MTADDIPSPWGDQPCPSCGDPGWGVWHCDRCDPHAQIPPRPRLINGQAIDAESFAWDGCHKVYLIRDADDLALMLSRGFTDDDDILPIVELPEVWDFLCPLRFIQQAADFTSVVDQDVARGAVAVFTLG